MKEVDDAVKIALATVALPFGIVPPVRVNGVDYVDGGVIDNVPFFPFIEDWSVSEIWVVLLDPFDNDEEALRHRGITAKHWSQLQRQREVAEFPRLGSVQQDSDFRPRSHLPYSEKNNPPRVVPFRGPKHFPKVTPFYPKRK